ncbi:complex I NDUFA9 subunit family protein [Vogesella sp. LIG4]|uniref:complex I NDUFA9 subunit family protein n=1 Tax=Vogesella sp. LIG4 TaxID=1192162 RepID=UPI00081FA7C3|nr:complex I NDUFA9 subunit family protein [Vogesella sp. LIG4]SCK25267.1 NADH dehydrogenase [Vogesella sp. LIG4]
MRIAIIGGAGFIGSYIAEYLSRDDHSLDIATRQRERHKGMLLHLPSAELVECNVHDSRQLRDFLAGHDAVISMVGILHGSRAAFEKAHVTLVAGIIDACKALGIRRLLHISALGAAANAPSDYQQTKGKGEALVKASGLDYTILRPSVVFGAGDSFLNMFAGLARIAPVLPLGGADTRFAPVWAGDVAQAVAACLRTPASIGQSLDLTGPREYTLRQLAGYAARLTGHPRGVIGLPEGIAMLQATLMELLPGPTLLSRDNVRSLRVDNISSQPFPSALLGFTPAALESIAPQYLGAEESNRLLDRYRERAARE